MAQEFRTQPAVIPVNRNSFPKINLVFDAAELIAKRTKGLVVSTKDLIVVTKDLVVILFILVLLLQHCIHYLRSG